MYVILGPCPCQGCRMLLFWARAAGGWPAAWLEMNGERHICGSPVRYD